MQVWPVTPDQNLLAGIELNILCVMEARLDESWQGEGMTLPFNRLYLVEEGGGLLDTGGGPVEMVPGMAYLVPAGVPLGYRCHGIMKKLYLHFSMLGPDRYDLMRGFNQIGVIPLPPSLTVTLPEELRMP